VAGPVRNPTALRVLDRDLAEYEKPTCVDDVGPRQQIASEIKGSLALVFESTFPSYGDSVFPIEASDGKAAAC
jgi:hypothetical protein